MARKVILFLRRSATVHHSKETRFVGDAGCYAQALGRVARLQSTSDTQDGRTVFAGIANDARAKGFYVLAKSAEQTNVGR